jgi:hypothetical protein
MNGSRRIQKIRRGVFRRWKQLRQRFVHPSGMRQLLFIVGCQRSGTTLLSRIFERDMNSASYGEASIFSRTTEPYRLRLRSMDEIATKIVDTPARLVVLKPLVESQNILQLLNHFTESRAIWLFRDFRDVAASNLHKFGKQNSIKDLRIIAEGSSDDWRNERLSNVMRDYVRSLYSENMSPVDAAVIFWIVRNQLFFDLALDQHRRIHLCKYESLTTDPIVVTKQIYDFIKQPYPAGNITAETHPHSIRKGKALTISPFIDEKAKALLAKMDTVWMQQKTAGAK